jgi:hypothetical protein
VISTVVVVPERQRSNLSVAGLRASAPAMASARLLRASAENGAGSAPVPLAPRITSSFASTPWAGEPLSTAVTWICRLSPVLALIPPLLT